MIYCSQPRALKSTATSSTNLASERERQTQKEAKKKKDVKERERMRQKKCTLTDTRDMVRKDKQSRELEGGWIESEEMGRREGERRVGEMAMAE